MPEAFPFTLPSGREIVMRYPDLWEIVFDESIPDPLTGIVEGLITKTMTAYGMATEAARKTADEKYDKIADADNGVQFIQLIVERCVVSPRIATTFEQARAFKSEGVDFLHIGQLGQNDIFAAYYSAMGVESALGALFQREESTDEPVEHMDNIGEDAPGGVESFEHTTEPAMESVHD